jgi:hypothetical protein
MECAIRRTLNSGAEFFDLTDRIIRDRFSVTSDIAFAYR